VSQEFLDFIFSSFLGQIPRAKIAVVMNDSRQLLLRDKPFNGSAVVYVMSRDQRVGDNHALLAAQACAALHKVPLYVVFVLKKVSGRSREHYQFMLDGLREVKAALDTHSIPFIMRMGEPKKEIISIVNEVEAGAVYFDFSPLHGARTLAKAVANDVDCRVSVVDTHNVIPAWVVSTKQEFAAHTMRTKVYKQLQNYLVAPPAVTKHQFTPQPIASIDFTDAQKFIETIRSAGISIQQASGEKAAHRQLSACIEQLDTYANNRNNIAVDYQSGLSPYVHYGQISSLRVVLDVMDSVDQPPLLLMQPKLAQAGDKASMQDGMNALFEELVVRKELADNFCLYSIDYRSIEVAADWAKKTLYDHADDKREFVYTAQEWEAATTHDEVWNASQKELMSTGKMHGYMRMYWAKKLLEWSKSPDEALKIAIYLNDKYSIDGGDPNGYVGILWSIAGLHDRPWFDRPVYGKIRYMNSAGLYRKFDVAAYIARVNSV